MDLLTEDQQRLVALRVRIAERRQRFHEIERQYKMRTTLPDPRTLALSGALFMLEQEFDVLAEIAGIETGVPS